MYMTSLLCIDVEKLDETHYYCDSANHSKFPHLPYKLPPCDRNDNKLPYKDIVAVMEDYHNHMKMAVFLKDNTA